MKTIEKVVEKIPEVLESLNLPEVSDIEIDDNRIIIRFEKYPNMMYFGKEENNNLQNKYDRDIDALMAIFDHLSEQEQVEVLEEMNLEHLVEDSKIHNLGDVEEEFVMWVVDQWNTIRWPQITFEYTDGILEFYDYDNAEWQWHPELIQEQADLADVSSYFNEMMNCLQTEFVEEMEEYINVC